MSQLMMWLMLFGGIVIGPSAVLLGYRWYNRRRRHSRRRRRA
jgi:hypothetical protein